MSRLVVIVTGAGQYRLKWEDGPVLASLPDDGMGPVPPTLAEWEHWKACRVLRERISHWRDTEGAWFETDPAATEAREIILEALAESWDHPQFILLGKRLNLIIGNVCYHVRLQSTKQDQNSCSTRVHKS